MADRHTDRQIDRRTDGPLGGPTDKAGCRVACTRLKNDVFADHIQSTEVGDPFLPKCPTLPYPTNNRIPTTLEQRTYRGGNIHFASGKITPFTSDSFSDEKLIYSRDVACTW